MEDQMKKMSIENTTNPTSNQMFSSRGTQEMISSQYSTTPVYNQNAYVQQSNPYCQEQYAPNRHSAETYQNDHHYYTQIQTNRNSEGFTHQKKKQRIPWDKQKQTQQKSNHSQKSSSNIKSEYGSSNCNGSDN